jgi:hypothetical protein
MMKAKSDRSTRERGNGPRLVVEKPSILVYDDFLAPADFEQLFANASTVGYQSVHADRLEKVWRIHDGAPLRGPGVRLVDGEMRHVEPAGRRFDDRARFDAAPLFSQIEKMLPKTQALLGERGIAWKEVTANPWIYPAGTGLSLHYDRGYGGSYTFFLHRRWRLHWGGILLVYHADRHRGEVPTMPIRSAQWFDDDDDLGAMALLEDGLALAVHPMPNRMVFIAGGTPHMVTRVDPNVGQNVRLSVAGFFQKETPSPVITLSTRLVHTRRRGSAILTIRQGEAGDGVQLCIGSADGETRELVRAAKERAAALRFIVDHREFFVRELPHPLGDEERIDLCSRLVRDGALRMMRP